MARILLLGSAGGMMFESIKKSWKKIQNDPPGKRFRRQYKRRQSKRKSFFEKIALIVLGVVIVVVGIIMLPAPGPGTIVIFLGLGFIAQESLYLSILLDKFEIRLRNFLKWCLKIWKEASIWLKITIILISLLLCAACIYGAYMYFWK